ncbi:MAG: replicative helicase loader/inhibitor [Oscillospiraceae bacterium]
MGEDFKIVPKDKTWLSIQTENALPLESINSQLLILQTAFPTVVRNYDEYEVQALQQLWYDIFKNVPEQLMREAIKRFIINDRKGFFPSPGQIVGYIEQIVAEQKEAEMLRGILEYEYEEASRHD